MGHTVIIKTVSGYFNRASSHVEVANVLGTVLQLSKKPVFLKEEVN